MSTVVGPTATPTSSARSGRLERMAAPLLSAGVVTAATLALRLRDPHVGGSWGICPSAALGFWCPGCGGLRAVNDLTHGQVLEAASSNLAFVVALPFVLIAFVVWSTDRWRGARRQLPPVLLSRGGLVLLGLALVFALVRNLPAGSWLAP